MEETCDHAEVVGSRGVDKVGTDMQGDTAALLRYLPEFDPLELLPPTLVLTCMIPRSWGYPRYKARLYLFGPVSSTSRNPYDR